MSYLPYDIFKLVAVGTHGCIKRREDRLVFKLGLLKLVEKLSPKTIIVYGAAPDDIFKPYCERGINIIPFERSFPKLIARYSCGWRKRWKLW